MDGPQIKIVGVGGAGCATVEAMLTSECTKNCELIAINTDAASLLRCRVPTKFLLGKTVTKGRSTGNNFKLGESAAEADRDSLRTLVSGAQILFIVAGIGGGTGAGATPVIASLAKNSDSVVVPFVTVPFRAEGKVCIENAAESLKQLKPSSDLIVVIQNDRILELTHSMPLSEAFSQINAIRLESIESMVEVVMQSGLSEIKPMLKGFATIGVGQGESVGSAAESSLSHLLITRGVLDVTGILLNIIMPDDSFSNEIGDAVARMSAHFPEAKIIWESNLRNGLRDKVRVVALSIGLNFVI